MEGKQFDVGVVPLGVEAASISIISSSWKQKFIYNLIYVVWCSPVFRKEPLEF
jgi:hypothetical protein